jgi:sulfur carrier protein
MPEETLQFNDRPLPCSAGLTLAALLQREGVDAARVATAVNARFVPREARADTPLQPGDGVITFEAIVGG